MQSTAVSGTSKAKGKRKGNQKPTSKKPEASWHSQDQPDDLAIHRFNSQHGLIPENSQQWGLKPGEHAAIRLKQTMLSTFRFKSDIFDPNGLTTIASRLQHLFHTAKPAVRKTFETQDSFTDLGQILMNHATFLDAWDDSVHRNLSIHEYAAYGLVSSLPGQAFGHRSTPRSMLPNIISSIIFLDRIFFTESIWPAKSGYFDHVFKECAGYSTNVDELRQHSSPIYYATENMSANTTSAIYVCWETLGWREKIKTIIGKWNKGDIGKAKPLVGFSEYSQKFIALAEVANHKSVQGACESSLQRAAWGFVTVYGHCPVRANLELFTSCACILTRALFFCQPGCNQSSRNTQF